MDRLQELIERLPQELRKEVERYIAELLDRADMSDGKRLKLGWVGALKDIDDPRSSVEIQHAISDMWIEGTLPGVCT